MKWGKLRVTVIGEVSHRQRHERGTTPRKYEVLFVEPQAKLNSSLSIIYIHGAGVGVGGGSFGQNPI